MTTKWVILLVANVALPWEEECTFANVGVAGLEVMLFFLFFFLVSVVPRRWWMAIGIAPVAMSLEVAYSVLPSMIYDKKVKGNLWLHHLPSCTLPLLPKRSSGESDWRSNRTHLVRRCGQAPVRASNHSVWVNARGEAGRQSPEREWKYEWQVVRYGDIAVSQLRWISSRIHGD